MSKPPRDPKKNRLIQTSLVLYSYGQAGLILVGVCYFTYFMTFRSYGISAKNLFVDMQNQYFPAISDKHVFITSDGRIYSARDQIYILSVVQTTWFLTLVCAQVCHLPFCRTISISVFRHGLFTNKIACLAIFVAVALGCIVVYIPGVKIFFTAYGPPMSLLVFAATMIALYCFLTLSELRKYIIRNHGNSWFSKNIIEW